MNQTINTLVGPDTTELDSAKIILYSDELSQTQKNDIQNYILFDGKNKIPGITHLTNSALYGHNSQVILNAAFFGNKILVQYAESDFERFQNKLEYKKPYFISKN